MSTSSLSARRDAMRLGRIILHPVHLLFSARVWKALAFVALNLPAGVIYFLVFFTVISVGLGTLPVGIGMLVLALAPPLTLIGAHIERTRARLLLGGELSLLRNAGPLTLKELLGNRPKSAGQSFYRRTVRPFFHRSWELARQRDTWRSLAYLLLLYPIGTLEAFGLKVQLDVFGSYIAQPTLAAMQRTPGIAASPWALLGLPEWGWLVALLSILVSMVWLFAEAYLILGMAHLHRIIAVGLLEPSPPDERARLMARVQELDESRTRLLDAVLMERQRLERDLHDGAQQRLVALAIDLGMAREKLATQPAVAQELIAQAHEEAKRALTELRELVRGIYPAVLTDRGLDPALSALAAHCPVSVTVTIELPGRPAEVVEATAYFVVAEALANIAKHSGATEASVEVRRVGDALRVEVSDNGRGGADSAAGSGLAGIADRVAALDGSLDITSPAGGPTHLVMDMPWQPGQPGKSGRAGSV
jgi:signal transduction histidine kinase